MSLWGYEFKDHSRGTCALLLVVNWEQVEGGFVRALPQASQPFNSMLSLSRTPSTGLW